MRNKDIAAPIVAAFLGTAALQAGAQGGSR